MNIITYFCHILQLIYRSLLNLAHWTLNGIQERTLLTNNRQTQTVLYFCYTCIVDKCSQFNLMLYCISDIEKSCKIESPPWDTTTHTNCIGSIAASIDSHWHVSPQTNLCLLTIRKLGVTEVYRPSDRSSTTNVKII